MLRFLYISLIACTLSGTVLAQTNTESDKRARNSNLNSNNAVQNELSAPSQDVKSKSYYAEEAADFEAQVKQTPTSAQAWLNLYKSSLFAAYNGSSKTLTAQQKESLTEIVEEMKLKIPGTFEYNLAVYLNGQHNTALIGNLSRAEELNANNADVVEQLVAYYSITDNTAKQKEYVTKFKKINKYETFIDDYAYNLLQSVDDNAILFTHGIMDTYPLYYQQLAQKVKQNVTIVNIDYLNSDTYRNALAKKLGTAFNYNGNNYTAAFEIASKMFESRNVYFSNAFSKNDLKKHAEKLNISGLAMQFGSSNNSILNNKNQWDKKFKKGTLEKLAMKDDYAKKMANNYLPMLISIYKYCKQSGQTTEAEKIKSLSLKIARINSNETLVSELLK